MIEESLTSEIQRSLPKSVQAGIPRLGNPRKGWRRVPLGELLYEVNRPIKLHDAKSYELVTVKRSRGGVISRGWLTGREISVKSQFLVEAGDFLISKRQIVHGACGIVPADLSNSIVSNEYCVLHARPELELAYLAQLTHSIYLQQTFFHSSIGVHVEKMIFKLDRWLKWEINLPGIAEQRKLATFLGAIDDKLTKLKRKKALLNDYKRGLMQKLFSQKLRFTRPDGSSFPDWQSFVLSDIGKTIGGLTGKSANDFGAGSPFITYRQVFDGGNIDLNLCGKVFIEEGEKQNPLRKGDVLITGSSETPEEVGYSAIFCEPNANIYLNSFCFAYRLNNPELFEEVFMKYAFTSPQYRNSVRMLAQGSTRYNISKIGFLALKMAFPTIQEQKRIGDCLSAIDAKIDTVATQIDKTEIFKKGLLQQMFV